MQVFRQWVGRSGRSVQMVVLVAGLIATSAATLAANQVKVIRFGVSNAGVGNPPRIQGGALAITQARKEIEKEFERDGIRIEWIYFKGQGPALNEAISNQQVDIATQGDLPSIIGRSVGLDTRIILTNGGRANSYILVPPDSPARSLKDLRGKRVSFNKGTQGQLSANRILDSVGLAERDIRVVNLEPGAAQAAFLGGDIDAIFGGISLLKHRDSGNARVIYDTRKAPVQTGQGHVLVYQPFARANPELVRRVVKAIVRSAAWGSDEKNRDEVIRLWSVGGITEAMYREELQGVPLSQRLSPLFDPFALARDKQSVEDAYRFKLIRKKFDVDAWVDRSYLDAALKELQLEHFWPRYNAAGTVLAQR
ncbi:putative aliphatic sulfonates-binding protein [Andreprevotia sp. IGB-42]|uniref:ABC transporter substrate-binding protein n=1 Tax=Andreprevotia sp. IGB-42 TaxID=2497473 RepID=UPI001358EA8D|nr:ABC transporter substrate-binding protein [Andreprevotia sp. IGB-42]KAF0815160.1 putative aliphatic sulfonates-binding protein [Andreprevotia sp. IGB-42]